MMLNIVCLSTSGWCLPAYQPTNNHDNNDGNDDDDDVYLLISGQTAIGAFRYK